MPDGECTGWFNGGWIDCCCQHDKDCAGVGCSLYDNYYLMQCVTASSYSSKVKYSKLVRVNAVLMFVGVTLLVPIVFKVESLLDV